MAELGLFAYKKQDLTHRTKKRNNIPYSNYLDLTVVREMQTNKLTNSMELNPSREANSCTVIQEIPSIIWNPKVHYRVHNSQTLISIPSQMNPAHNPHPISLR
jgi:hypothetical protein